MFYRLLKKLFGRKQGRDSEHPDVPVIRTLARVREMHDSRGGQIPEAELHRRLERLDIDVGGDNCPLAHLRKVGYVEKRNGNYSLTESALEHFT